MEGRFSRRNETDDVDTKETPVVQNGTPDVQDGTPDTEIKEMIDERSWPEEKKKKEKRRILKNVIVISIVFLLNFTAFQGLSRLQSVLHQVEGMGTINSAVLYVALVFSCLLLPKICICKLGYKGTIIVCIIGYIIWVAANGLTRWWTLTPASIIVGLASGPLWTAQFSYFSKLCVRYSKLVGETEVAIVSRFFGIFFMVAQSSSIFGSIISSTVMVQALNGTPPTPSEKALQLCGVNDCPGNNATNSNMQRPSDAIVWGLVGVFVIVAVPAVILTAIFMDKLPKELEDESEKKFNFRKDIPSFLVATIRHWRHPKQIFIIPLNIYSGFQQATFNVEWTRSYISCALSVSMIGLATLPFGFVNIIVSFVSGWLVKKIGRIPIFVAGMCVDLAVHLTLYFWMPHPSQPAVFFVISGMWGFIDAIWQTHISALYGSIFTEEPEAAFANYGLFVSIGFIIAFSYSSAICMLVKLAIMTSFLLLGMIGYFATEFVHHRNTTSKLKLATVTTVL